MMLRKMKHSYRCLLRLFTHIMDDYRCPNHAVPCHVGLTSQINADLFCRKTWRSVYILWVAECRPRLDVIFD